MRKYRDKALNAWKFKGSVFVAYPTREDAEKVVEIKSLKFGGNELIVLWQYAKNFGNILVREVYVMLYSFWFLSSRKDYIEKKKAERLQVKQKVKEEVM